MWYPDALAEDRAVKHHPSSSAAGSAAVPKGAAVIGAWHSSKHKAVLQQQLGGGAGESQRAGVGFLGWAAGGVFGRCGGKPETPGIALLAVTACCVSQSVPR